MSAAAFLLFGLAFGRVLGRLGTGGHTPLWCPWFLPDGRGRVHYRGVPWWFLHI